MKKIKTISFFVLLSTIFAQSQTEKGRWIIEPSAKFSSAYNVQKTFENEKTKSFNVNFSPYIGRFIIDNFALGLKPTIGYSNYKDADFGDANAFAYGFGPYARLYFGGNNFRPFIEGNMNYGMAKTTYSYSSGSYNDDITVKHETLNWGALGGFSYFFNDNVALSLGLSYHHVTYRYGDSSINSVDTSSTLLLSTGFLILL